MRNSNKTYIFFMACILGTVLAFIAKDISGDFTFVPFKLINDYQKVIEKERSEIKRFESLVDDMKIKISEFKSEQAGGDLQTVLEKELQEYKIITGYVPVEGPGVLVILSDGERGLLEGENPNNLLIHDVDVLNIVNDLKVAGAEAISINGQRLISISEINCAGPTIKINDQVYAQPYIIKAIGNPDYLQAAMKAPGTYGNLLKQVGLFIETNTSVNVRIPAYDSPVEYDYITIPEEQVKS